MKGKFKIIAGILVAVVLIAAAGSAVIAAAPTLVPGAAYCQGGGFGGYGIGGDCLEEVSKLTGLTEEDA
jgi:hypothetical protein